MPPDAQSPPKLCNTRPEWDTLLIMDRTPIMLVAVQLPMMNIVYWKHFGVKGGRA